MPDDKPHPIKDIHRCSKAAVAKAFGYKSPSTIDKWDCPRNGGGTYDLPAVIKWRIQEQVEKVLPIGDDPLMGGGSSPNLELYRGEAAKMAKYKRLQMEGELIHAETMGGILADLSSLLRGLGDRLQARFGPDANKMLTQALAAYDKKLRKSMKSVSKTK